MKQDKQKEKQVTIERRKAQEEKRNKKNLPALPQS